MDIGYFVLIDWVKKTQRIDQERLINYSSFVEKINEFPDGGYIFVYSWFYFACLWMWFFVLMPCKKTRNNEFNSVLRTVYIRNVYNHLIYTSTYTTCYTIEGWNCPHCQTIVSPGIADILVSQLILLRDIPRCDFLQRKIWRLRTYNSCVPRILT